MKHIALFLLALVLSGCQDPMTDHPHHTVILQTYQVIPKPGEDDWRTLVEYLPLHSREIRKGKLGQPADEFETYW